LSHKVSIRKPFLNFDFLENRSEYAKFDKIKEADIDKIQLLSHYYFMTY